MYLYKHSNKVIKIEPNTYRQVLGEVSYPKDYILKEIIISPVLDTEYSSLRLLLTNTYAIPNDGDDITLSNTNLPINLEDMSLTADKIQVIGSNSGADTAIYNILFVFKRFVAPAPEN